MELFKIIKERKLKYKTKLESVSYAKEDSCREKSILVNKKSFAWK